MKKIIIFILTLIMASTINLVAHCETKTQIPNHPIYISFNQYRTNSSSTNIIKDIPKKSERSHKAAGNIRYLFDDNVPDSIRDAFEMAARIWSTKIHSKQPILIQVISSKLDENLTSKVEVLYRYFDGYVYPDVLLAEKGITSYSSSIKGIIELNSSINWNCSYSNNPNLGSYNALSMCLRSLAICLGFGASIFQENGKIGYYAHVPSIFDKYLWSNEEYLISKSQGTSEFKSFIESESVVFKGTQNYKMYSPTEYEPWKSLVFLDDTSSLMHFDFHEGDKYMNIDDKTIDILNFIGWDIEYSPEIEIESLDLKTDGRGSAYESHSFRIDSHNKDVSEIKWVFSLKNNEGLYEIVNTGNGITFDIAKISKIDNYKRNINGDLDGLIELSCNWQGKVLTAPPFFLSLELKPIILRISEMTEVKNPKNDCYQLLFNVDYRGADYITLSLEEEYNSLLYTQRYDEPIRAHIASPYISPEYYSWMDIIVSNQYGSDSQTIELKPKSSKMLKAANIDTPIGLQQDIWNVYDSMGNYLGLIDNKDNLKQKFGAGLYILRKTDTTYKVCKIIIK